MPYGINVADGTAPTDYSLPVRGASFVWLNYDTTTSVQISNCGNWCTPDSCTVPAATPGSPVTPGQSSAQILAVPNGLAYAFSDSGWDAPNMPHISAPGQMIEKNEENAA